MSDQSGNAGEIRSDATTTVAQLKNAVLQFSRERNWEQFHHPKDLGLAMAIEVGEVLEHFRFHTNEQITEELADVATHTALAHELADVFWALLRLADVCQIDLSKSLNDKLQLASEKYPVEKSRGLPYKYTRYQ